ncbi:helix-turn-helix transcriptional regulator [Streptomyces rimosus]|uniref:helix-turn-helix domain-containing protein n=1 Tax=Streptomyces rimosus TaxID=1927 RepID=UPI000517D5C0|nr:helix-turn-helix transcriptional regulator [Streptomyces rimosus]
MAVRDSEAEEESAREVLARELQRLRGASGKSLAQLSDEVNYDRTYLSRLENGERLSKREVMETLDRAYGTDQLLVGLWKLARRETFPDRYKRFMWYEAMATFMHKYMMVMPGLLQTEEYARAVLSSAPTPIDTDELDELVVARMGRQEMLSRSEPPSLRVILDESVLGRPLADDGAWQRQLAHLVGAAEEPNITLQVLPLNAGVHDLMGGSLSLLWMADGTTVAYLEGNKSGDLIEEAAEVAQYRRSYEHLRDLALQPGDSVAFIKRLLEDSRA